ncbi:MAG: SurA N-terminal domain-containing protein [Alphaproteobacteria bacterium]|nr:SurA N-terminal domain-containing protein [Alphaproteobacteria bacterium]
MKRLYKHLAENLKTILFTIVMLILIFSFGLWGVADVIRNILHTQNAAVEINGQKISNVAIDSNFKKDLYFIGQQNNTSISLEDGVRAGLLNTSVKKMISEIALNTEADSMGIRVSDDLAAKLIAEEPYFQDENGNFDAEKFKSVIAYSGYRKEKQFIDNLKQEKARVNLLSIITSGAKPLAYSKELLNKYNSEVRNAKYIILPIEESKVEFSDEDLTKYYNENLHLYREPVLHDISVLVLSSSGEEKSEEAEDELLSKVDLAENLLFDELSIEEISEELGTDIITIKNVDPMNADSVKTELVAKQDILGTLLELSSTETPTSELKETVNGEFFIVRIDETKGNEAKPFAKVKEEVKEKYISQKAEDLVRGKAVAAVKQINASEKTLEDIAKEENLKVQTSSNFHRRPTIEELSKLSPIAIAQLFTKEKEGEAGLSIIEEGVFLFTLNEIDYEEKKEVSEQKDVDTSYTIMEAYANSLLDKYKAKINYNALDKLYEIE